eukprot:357415-Chlamydomonas_euryale.AAC.15
MKSRTDEDGESRGSPGDAMFMLRDTAKGLPLSCVGCSRHAQASSRTLVCRRGPFAVEGGPKAGCPQRPQGPHADQLSIDLY